jgi:hypothetical protein
MKNDGRCLKLHRIEQIHRDFIAGLYNDHDLQRIFETTMLQRRVLREIFNHFQTPALRRYSHVDALPNSQLAYWKELVSMEEGP